MERGCRGGTETHLVCCGSFFFIRRQKKKSLWVHMSKESSIKVICWSLKYARTCFSARSETHMVPEGGADEGSCWANGRAGHTFHMYFGITLGWESPPPTWRQVQGLSGNQSLWPSLLMGLKGSSFLEADQKEWAQKTERCGWDGL